MGNESTTGGPLTATLGEQLAGKGHLGTVHEAGMGTAPGGAGEGPPHAGAEVEPQLRAEAERREQPGSAAPRGQAHRVRRAAVELPWGAILAAGAGWVLAKTVASGVRRRARRMARGLRRR